MAAVEGMMASSAKEEIPPPISNYRASRPHTASIGPDRPMKTSPLLQPRVCQTRRRSDDDDHRIGTWIHGVAGFDATNQTTTCPVQEEHPHAKSALRRALDKRRARLSLQIPLTSESAPSPLQHPIPKRAFSMPLCEEIPPLVTPPAEQSKAVDSPHVDRTRPLTPELRTLGSSHKSRQSRSSSSSKSTADYSSVYSRRSSMTTVDTSVTADHRPFRSPSGFSILSPAEAGVFDDMSPRSSFCLPNAVDINKPLPPLPVATPRPVPAQAARSHTPGLLRPLSTAPHKRHGSKALLQSRSLNELNSHGQTWYRPGAESPCALSPTLGQAEIEVQTRLRAMGRRRSSCHSFDDQANERFLLERALKRKDSGYEGVQSPEPAPMLPKKSRKREWRAHKQMPLELQQSAMIRPPSRRRSEAQLESVQKSKCNIPLRRWSSLSSDEMPILPAYRAYMQGESDDTTQIAGEDANLDDDSSSSALAVLLQILGSIDNVTDLLNAATINRGMYHVFKKHGMCLIRTVISNQSAAAHELRQWRQYADAAKSSSKSPSLLNDTPQSYLACYRREVAVIARLKRLIREQCQTFIRRETSLALSTPTHPNAQRFDDALLRIWSFCTIFGAQKGRQDDITGQLDWLKGGLLSDYQGCAATVNTNLDFDMSSILLNAPDHFAAANRGGLSAPQLYDMTEMWICLCALLQGYGGRAEQAREYGVFDNCDIAPGDSEEEEEEEEQCLEEWLSYILTLGPHVVLELALLASDQSPAGFALAKQSGWTDWKLPLYASSLRNFFREPVAIMYHEQVAAAHQRLHDPHEQEQKELSRKRVAALAAEIRLHRQSSDYKRLPLIDMSTERPMSMIPRRNSTTSTRSTGTTATTSSSRTALSRSSSTLPSSTVSLRSPPSYWTLSKSISPILEDTPELKSTSTSSQRQQEHQRQHDAPDTVEEEEEEEEQKKIDGDVAVRKLVSMGFPVTLARQALKVTDDGTSMRVDRAVEYLLHQE